MYFGFKNISIAYKKKEVLNNVTLDFPKGRIITLIGPNGCGKSSLLKVVSKAVKPKSGTVWLEDRNIHAYSPKILAQKLAMLPQVHSSPPDINVRTLVSYGRYPYMRFGRGLDGTDRQAIDEALALTGLEKLQYRTVGTLSGGERQRSWIAMALCQKPEILILDEPTTYLDIGFQIELLELVKYLNETLGITIIMVLHDINLAARYSSLLYVIKDKGLYAAGEPRQILNGELLKSVFNIKADIYEDKTNGSLFFIPLKAGR